MDNYQKLALLLQKATNIVFFTGAGISVPSGIPDFRSANGLYNSDLKAEEYLSRHFFDENPERFYDFYKTKMCYPQAQANDAHKFIAELDNVSAVITQNIDGLHSFAGSKKVIELHGSIYRNHCMQCNETYDLSDILNSVAIPRCSRCGGIIKPDVVLYEESLNSDDINEAIDKIADSQVLIVVGTSLNVYPAASFIRYFKGSHLVLINKSITPFDKYADIVIHEDIVEVVRKIKEAII